MARVLFLKNNGLGPLLLFFFLLVLFASCVLTEEEQHPFKEVKRGWESFSTKNEQERYEEDEEDEEEEEEEKTWYTRQTMDPILYPYVLDNECTVNIQHNVTSSPEDQATVFDFISLLVSDVRMILPDTCRRGSLWLLCNLAFPCQGEDCSVTREDCDYAFKDCPPSDAAFNCSSFPSEDEEKRRYWGGEEKGWVFEERNGASGDSYWVTVEESSQIPNPVTTCLGEDGDDIDCCIEPFTMDRNTEECVLKCPAYLFGETRFKAMTYTHFALLWIATIMVVIALFPLFFLKQTLTFPKYAMPAALIASVLWLHNELWAVYVGFEEYVCGEEQDLFVAYDEFLESSTCFAQFYIFHFFGIMTVALIFSVTFVFLYIFTYGDRDLRNLEKPFLLFVIGTPFIFLFVLLPLIETLNESPLDFGFGFSCVIPREGRGIFVFTYFTVLVGMNLACWIFSVIMLVRRSRYLFFLHWRMFFFMGCQVVVQALFLGFVNGIVPKDSEELLEAQENYATCVALNPRVEDACEYDTDAGTYAYWCVYFFTLDFATGAIAFVVYIIQPANRQWWGQLFSEGKAAQTLSRTSMRQTSHSNLSQNLERSQSQTMESRMEL